MRAIPRNRDGHRGAMPRSRKQSVKRLVRIWTELFREHDLLAYASAIAFQALVALVALLLLTVAVLGEIGREDVWTNQVAPKIESKVLFDVFAGINQTFDVDLMMVVLSFQVFLEEFSIPDRS